MRTSARPINVRYAECQLITRAYFDNDLQAVYNSKLGPVQNGCGISGGISITAFGVMAMLDAQPDFGTIQRDIKNGSNEVKRESILGAMKVTPGLSCTLASSHALLEPMTYIGMGSGTNLVTAPFRSEEGSHQGSIEGGWFFALAANAPFQKLSNTLVAVGGSAMAIINDNYAMGLPSIIFSANAQLMTDLAVIGLELHPAKLCCYINAAHRDDKWHRLRGNIPEGVLHDGDEVILVNGQPLHGMLVCNVPVGTAEFVVGYLEQRLRLITHGFTEVKKLLDPERWPNPEIPVRQMLWILTLVCFQSMEDY